VVDAKTGKVSATPLPPAVIAQINELVKQAMGYSQQRGDTFAVTNAPFEGVDKPAETPPKIEWYRDPSYLPLGIQVGKYALAALVIAFLYYRILRPLVRQFLRRYDEITELPPEPEEQPPVDPQAMVDDHLAEEAAHQQGKSYRSNLQIAKDLARDDPRIVANVVKTWVGTNE
jgi:flagellar M-ring protein FliF